MIIVLRSSPLPCGPFGLESFGQKIPFHRKLADFDVQVVYLGLMTPQSLLGAIHGLTFPSAHLVGTHFVARGILLDRATSLSASNVTFTLKSNVKRRRVVISYPPSSGGIVD
ncbi:hypothetical protein N9F34_05070 [Alphaproteobacteria bacterium]|nr:hypothetical protein [Alphaproteobacteria bacterium]